MRIAVLSPYADPVKGGISSYTRELIDAYRGLGTEAQGLAALGEPNSRFLILGPSKIAYSIRAFLRIASLKPDLIHAHSHWYVLFPGLLIRRVRRRSRVLFTFHTLPLGVEARLGYRMLRGMFRFCDGVTFVSKQLHDAVNLPSSIPQRVVRPAPETMATQAGMVYPTSNHPTILFVGPLVWPAKVAGVELLMQAFALIADRNPTWRLVVLGDGPFRASLQAKAVSLGLEGRVWLPGDAQNVFAELAGADLYAHVSFQEGLPLSLLNAMAMGKPILATPVGGIPEVIDDGITGRLVSPSVEALASALRELLADEALRRRLGDAARDWISRELTWEKVASSHIDLARKQ